MSRSHTSCGVNLASIGLRWRISNSSSSANQSEIVEQPDIVIDTASAIPIVRANRPLRPHVL